jgi:hypothetical protein
MNLMVNRNLPAKLFLCSREPIFFCYCDKLNHISSNFASKGMGEVLQVDYIPIKDRLHFLVGHYW